MKDSSKYTKPKDELGAVRLFLEILERYIKLKKVEEKEKTKRLKLEQDIKIIRTHTENYIKILNRVASSKIEEREKILNFLLNQIDTHIENPELINSLLEVFTTVMKSPLISEFDKKLEALAKDTIDSILEENNSILEKDVIEI